VTEHKRHIGSWILATLLVLVLAAGGWTAWQWVQQVTLQEVRISGHVNVQEEEVLDLLRVDTGLVMFDINAVILEDRVVRHPWIRQADVARLPSGILDISIEERTPVAMLMSTDGHVDYWVDAEGWRLPVTGRARYDVPLLYAVPQNWHPMQPLAHGPTRELIRDLDNAGRRMDALFSEFVWGADGWTVHLTPAPPHGSIPALLGEFGYAAKFEVLLGFWDQQVLQYANKIYDRVDLRFDSQVVVEERPRPGYANGLTNNNNE
jgi:cell division protein FtsQ